MKSSFFSFLIFFLATFAQAAQSAERDPNMFYGRSFSSSGDTLHYRVMYPKGYTDESKTKYPLVVVLHGADSYSVPGQRYNGKQLSSPVANLFKQTVVKDSFPAIVLYPQCEEVDAWTEMYRDSAGRVSEFPLKAEQTYWGELVENMVKYYVKHYPVDDKRVYIIGMGAVGGSGALDLAVRKPKTYAAVVSIGGAVNPTRAKKLTKTPLRLYSSPSLKEVTISQVRDVFLEIKAAGGKMAEPVVEIAADDEDVCVRAAASSSGFLKWIFSKKK